MVDSVSTGTNAEAAVFVNEDNIIEIHLGGIFTYV